jgi:16S rRNA (guanine527-N7)-methyltransferase
MTETLKNGFAELGLSPDENAVPRLETYFRLLDERNRVMNLTAITGEEETARMHFLDSAAVLTLENFSGASVIDVGTGAGFPGLPMKICSPDIRLTLLDSLGKRVNFLYEVCRQIGMDDVACIHARAEEAAADMRESFDFAVSRAVARLNLLCELCLPFVRVGGAFVAMKGAEAKAEANEAGRAVSILGGRIERIAEYTVPGTDIVHRAVVIRKEKSTPEKYPRRFAKIQKDPL